MAWNKDKKGNYHYQADSLKWAVEDAETLKRRLIKEMVQMMPPKRPVTGPRAYVWTASLPGGYSRITGTLVVDDDVFEDVVRMRAYQKFRRHVELEAASPGTLSCYHISREGGRAHVGFFPSSGVSPSSGNIHLPTAMGDLELYVAIEIRPDREKQRELDEVDPSPRGPEVSLEVWDEINDLPVGGVDVADSACALGCSCPLDGQDVALTGTELEL